MAKIEKTDDAWRAELGDELTFQVTRHAATERPFSHPGFPEAPGRFVCRCCGAPLFESSAKFDSGCGWPSFFQPLSDAPVAQEVDDSLGMRRIEVRCEDCDAHLGHVFPDGPAPTGLRYCINGVALTHQVYDNND